MSLLLVSILLVHSGTATGTSVLEIKSYTQDNNVKLQCRENQFNGQASKVLRNESLFLFNSTGQSVTLLLKENRIHYEFDRDSRGVLSFEVQQNIEGYYYCSRDKSAGLPDDEDDYRTILAHPTRKHIPTCYIKQVGEPVTLHSGVGEGALAAHYTSRWFKDGFQLENANVSRGKDFSLHIEPVELSNAGEYVSSVTIDDIGHVYIVEENERPIILTVFKSPVIEHISHSIVVDEEESKHKNVSLNCVVTGAPSLRVSWLKGRQNLTFANPFRYSIYESMVSNNCVRSTLIIRHPTYEDSGRYTCISTILNDTTGTKEFVAQENATLTVLESDFALRTVVTEHQQLQLWIELHVPLFHAVTAVVYFTLKEKRHIQQHITTNSVLTENTMMVFQLESHEIPEKFQKEDFLVQVALRVGTKEGSVVPRNLEEASTSNLDKPTVDCSRDISKYGVFVTTPLGIIGGLLAVIAVAFSVYKIYKEHQKTKRRANVSAAEKERLENDIKEFLEALENPSLDETKKRVYIEKLKKTLNINRGLLVGDGPEDDEEEDCLIEQ